MVSMSILSMSLQVTIVFASDTTDHVGSFNRRGAFRIANVACDRVDSARMNTIIFEIIINILLVSVAVVFSLWFFGLLLLQFSCCRVCESSKLGFRAPSIESNIARAVYINRDSSRNIAWAKIAQSPKYRNDFCSFTFYLRVLTWSETIYLLSKNTNTWIVSKTGTHKKCSAKRWKSLQNCGNNRRFTLDAYKNKIQNINNYIEHDRYKHQHWH